MKLQPDEIEEILTRVVKGYLRRVTHIKSREEKAKEIAHMCHVGGGTDTCNLVGEFEDLSQEVLRKINELLEIKLGMFVGDMHYGLPTQIGYEFENGPKIKCFEHCRTTGNNTSKELDEILQSKGIDVTPTNKHAVVAGKEGDAYMAMYSYDNHTLGSFWFKLQ
jgi:hypothetical protein